MAGNTVAKVNYLLTLSSIFGLSTSLNHMLTPFSWLHSLGRAHELLFPPAIGSASSQLQGKFGLGWRILLYPALLKNHCRALEGPLP